MPARLFLRWIANSVDALATLLTAAAGVAILTLTPVGIAVRDAGLSLVALLAGLACIVTAFVFTLTRDSNPSGASLGKRLVGIAVVDYETREPCTKIRVVGRNLLTLIFNCTFILAIVDLVAAIASAEHRRLVDTISGTIVVADDGMQSQRTQPSGPQARVRAVRQGHRVHEFEETLQGGDEYTIRVPRASLRVIAGPGTGKEFSLADAVITARPVILGRGRDSSRQFVGLESRLVSRQHAQIACENGAWVLKHMSDTNATVVDGVELTRVGQAGHLKNGSRIDAGDVSLELRVS